MNIIKRFLKEYGLHIVFTQALIATFGSLYFSEIAQFPPCTLCWYQRIAIYPVTLISAAAIIMKDRKRVAAYILPVSILGWIVALYHNLLSYKLITEAITTCVNGVSCTTEFINWGGFITIPLLSFLALTVIIVFTIIYHLLNKKSNE